MICRVLALAFAGAVIAGAASAAPAPPQQLSCHPVDRSGHTLPQDIGNGGFVCEEYAFFRLACKTEEGDSFLPHCFGTQPAGEKSQTPRSAPGRPGNSGGSS